MRILPAIWTLLKHAFALLVGVWTGIGLAMILFWLWFYSHSFGGSVSTMREANSPPAFQISPILENIAHAQFNYFLEYQAWPQKVAELSGQNTRGIVFGTFQNYHDLSPETQELIRLVPPIDASSFGWIEYAGIDQTFGTIDDARVAFNRRGYICLQGRFPYQFYHR